ncbi:hypothetical protein J6590_020817 [Homalodisca vitripennis]|nr:hypothetical protein J6590_020817 [Homalodisca vitripennis]
MAIGAITVTGVNSYTRSHKRLLRLPMNFLIKSEKSVEQWWGVIVGVGGGKLVGMLGHTLPYGRLASGNFGITGIEAKGRRRLASLELIFPPFQTESKLTPLAKEDVQLLYGSITSL